MSKMPVSKILRSLAVFLDNLSPEDLESFLAGRGRLVFIQGDTEEKIPHDAPSLDTLGLITALSGCSNREDAQKLLGGVENKERLILLAKAMKVHTVKNDRREDVENKIITFAIGGKLRSEALSTLKLGTSSDESQAGG